MSNYTDELDNLVDIAVDDAYEGKGTNNRILGRMYFYKKYETAAKAEYDKLRKEVELPEDISEKTSFGNDKVFSAVATPRQGSAKLDRTLLRAELIALIGSRDKLSSREASIAADELLGRCTSYSADSVAVQVVEDRRD